ncbi:MAG: FUSC family protein [Spartobacteria bacterium]
MSAKSLREREAGKVLSFVVALRGIVKIAGLPMNATAETALKPISAPGSFWRWLVALPRDGSFRFSVKFGMAGILALFVALLNKTHEPTWALFTVFVLMVAQYIGAVEEKSILRIIGTVVGGFAGYLITAAFQQDPLIYFSLLGLLVAFATAMFGQSRYPYAFLLCAMTAVVVCSNGLSDPENSWIYMIWRIQEVVIGILSVLLVQSLLWPRYAADEFLTGLRGLFRDLRGYLSSIHSDTPGAGLACEERLNQLRQLLRFGARESRYFRAKMETYIELLASVRRIHNSIRPIAGLRWKNPLFLEYAGRGISELHQALDAQLALLASPTAAAGAQQKGLDEINRAVQALKQSILDMRRDPRSKDAALEDILALSLESLSLEEIHQELVRCRDLLEGLPLKKTKSSAPKLRLVMPGVPPSFWIKNGIRSAISMIAALILMNWVHPPGGVTMVLCAWLFCCLLPNSPEGRGDLRAWHVVVVAIPCLFLLCIGLVFATPLLSSYAVMNILIFTWLFVYGQVAYKTPGVTTLMNVSMMGLVGILGLNAQEPVPFQSIADVFFGVSTGTLMAALFQRTLWPLLPQREMRERFLELLRIQRTALASGSPTQDAELRLRLLPGEIHLRLANMVRAVYPDAEIPNLRALLDHLDRFTANRIWESDPCEAGNSSALTQKIREGLSGILEKIETSFSTGGPCSIDVAPLRATIAEFDDWILAVRLEKMSHNADPFTTAALLGRAARYQNAATHLIAAAEIAAKLNPSLYSKDNAI